MTELKPCPFCNGEAHIHTNTGWGTAVVIECKNCGARFEEFEPSAEKNLKTAIEKWNRRAE